MFIQLHAISQWHQLCSADKEVIHSGTFSGPECFAPSSAHCGLPWVIVVPPAAPVLLDRQQIHECPFGASSVRTTNNWLFLIKIIVKQCNIEQLRFGPSSVRDKLTDAQ